MKEDNAKRKWPQNDEPMVQVQKKVPKQHISQTDVKNTDVDRVGEDVREQHFSDSVCGYCSSSSMQIRHQHFSTFELRELAFHSENGNIMCPICQVPEPLKRDENGCNRFILTDSTLYGIWEHPDLPKLARHFDIECIIDGNVNDFVRALRKITVIVKGRLEVIVVAGITNVEQEETVEEIMKQFMELKELVRRHSIYHCHTVPGYVSVSTLCLPPKLCALRLPESTEGLKEWVPKQDFVDRYPVIRKLNEEIKKMNLKESISFLNIHMQGVKMLKSGPQHKFDTRPDSVSIWSEKEVFQKRHFTMENKLKLIKYLENTFKSNQSN